MFKTICSYTLKTLFRQRKRLVAAVAALALCLALLVAIINITLSIATSYTGYLDYSYGDYAGLVGHIPNEAPLLPRGCEARGYIRFAGHIRADNSIYGSRLAVGSISDGALPLCPVRLLDGRLPAAAGEAAIERSLGERLGIDVKIGEAVELSVVGIEGEKRITVTVVGIIDDYALAQMPDSDASVWPSVVVAHGLEAAPVIEYVVFSSDAPNKLYAQLMPDELDTDGEEDTEDELFLKKLAALGVPLIVNPRYTPGTIVHSVSTSSAVMLSIVAVSTVLIAVMCLYSYYAASEGETAAHIRNLRLLGAGKRELMLFTAVRTSAVFLLALVLGLLLGIGGSALFSRLIVGRLVGLYALRFSPLSIAAPCVLLLIITLALNFWLLRELLGERPFSQRHETVNRRAYRMGVKNKLHKWMIASALNRRRTYVGIVLSVSFCFFVVFVGVMFGYTIEDDYGTRRHGDEAYRLRLSSFLQQTAFHSATDPFYGISDTVAREFMQTGETQSVSYIKYFTAVIEDGGKNETLHGIYGQSLNEDQHNDPRYIVEQFGIDESSVFYRTNINEADGYLLSRLLSHDRLVGETDPARFKDGRQVLVLYRKGETSPYGIGDSVTLLQLLPLPEYKLGDSLEDNSELVRLELTVAAVLPYDEIPQELRMFYANDVFFVFGEGSFAAHDLPVGICQLFIHLLDDAAHERVDEALFRLKTAMPELQVTSRVLDNEEGRALRDSMIFAAASLSIFIAGICLAIYISIVRGKYLAQRRLWGALRAIGLKKGSVVAAHLVETFVIAALAVGINAGVVAILRLLPIRDIPFFSPALLLSYLAFALLAAVGTLPSVTAQFKDSVISQIEHIE